MRQAIEVPTQSTESAPVRAMSAVGHYQTCSVRPRITIFKAFNSPRAMRSITLDVSSSEQEPLMKERSTVSLFEARLTACSNSFRLNPYDPRIVVSFEVTPCKGTLNSLARFPIGATVPPKLHNAYVIRPGAGAHPAS